MAQDKQGRSWRGVVRGSLVFLYDSLMVPIAWLLAYWLRFNLHTPSMATLNQVLIYLPLIMLIQGGVCWWFGLYRGLWHFASLPDLIKIIRAAFIGTLLASLALFLLTRLNTVPRSVIPLYFVLYTALLGGARFLYRWLHDYGRWFSHQQRVLIIGAGAAGEGLVRNLSRDRSQSLKPIAFLDDAREQIGREIHGLRVVGSTSSLNHWVDKLSIDLIILAIPTISSSRMRDVVTQCSAINIPLRTLPSVNDIVDGRVTIDAIREVAIEDLLGRDPVKLDKTPLLESLHNKVVMVTGGGGSIGAELSRQIAALSPSELIVFDNCELNLYHITNELRQAFPGLNFVRKLVDVSDRSLVEHMMRQYRPNVIFHAAAYKHVPMLESQIELAVKNNICGTRNVADMADKYQSDIFVYVSTDKAVNPTNIMGTTKRVGEIYCQNLNTQSHTRFITVRFGNVLGSTGSVVPLFQQQIAAGGPVTVTHPKMTRFFMTIKEAVSLILQASAMGKGGEIFVLDMGEPVSIRYLAEQMIRLSGRRAEQDIKIAYSGLRAGEKLSEELFHEGESRVSTEHEKIFMTHSRQHPWDAVTDTIVQLEMACCAHDEERLLTLLLALVPEYQMLRVPTSAAAIS